VDENLKLIGTPNIYAAGDIAKIQTKAGQVI